MNYLAISEKTDRILYCVFNDRTFKYYELIEYSSLSPLNQAQQIYETISNVIARECIDIVIVKWIDYLHIQRTESLNLIQQRTLIRLACAYNSCVYLEGDTYGWERYQAIITKKEKLDIIKYAYGLEEKLKKDKVKIKNDGESIADCITICETLAFQFLKSKPIQPIDYKWKLL